ncbi:hypothetical protein PHSC3_001628 [Chlamydiales bacterium STE3]|nr:hypothetical protein PHSC3_001628 [Chlamydiales bacterium STE3]
MTKRGAMTQQKSPSPLPWYQGGLNFKCTECGKCCTGTSGFVWVSEEEMTEMAAVLSISLPLFKRNYTRKRDNRYALIEKKTANEEYDCVFLKDKKCQVYRARPLQCRTFPWWSENLMSKESWEIASLECEGINDEAPLVPYQNIVEQLESQE